MPRRKKRKQRSPTENSLVKKKPDIFNPMKGDLCPVNPNGASDETPPTRPEAVPSPEQDEADTFFEALRDVTPLSEKKKKIIRRPDPHVMPAHTIGNDDLEAMAHLSDLVSGNVDIDITFTDEYIEGSVAGFSRKLMKQLKKGMFPVQDYVDLHGLTKQEAEYRVRDFLTQSHGRGLRCVLIIHGKGLNSEYHIPVLKERLPVWLKRGPAKKIVLAFSTAMPYDGGTGALYVVLRARTKKIVKV